MELARLASSKQLHRALSGPRSHRGPKIEKNGTTLSGMAFFWFRHTSSQRTLTSKTKFYKLPRYPGWFSATFAGPTVFSVGPPPVGNGDLVVFWPVLGTWRNSRPGPKTEKHNFAVLGEFFLPRCLGWLFATFLQFTFGPTGPPRAANREIQGFWAILALLTPREILGSGRKRKIASSWC